MIEEILLLPAVERFVEGRHQLEVLRSLRIEEFVDLLKGRTVIGLALHEGPAFQGEQIGVAQVLDQRDAAMGDLVVDLRDIELGAFEELRDRQEIVAVRPLVGPVDADEGVPARGFHADDRPAVLATGFPSIGVSAMPPNKSVAPKPTVMTIGS